MSFFQKEQRFPSWLLKVLYSILFCERSFPTTYFQLAENLSLGKGGDGFVTPQITN